MFDNLTDKLQQTFKKLTGKGKLSESNIADAMVEVRMALLDADVNYNIVQDFIEETKQKCLGEIVLKSVSPGQQLIKIVNDSLADLMGAESSELIFNGSPSVIMLVGLHGAGKTTTVAKLAVHLKKQNKSVMLAACDVYRPAAIDQLETLAESIDVPVYTDKVSKDVVQIANSAFAMAKSQGIQVLIVDTAGRLQIDEDMIQELVQVKSTLNPAEIILTADSALGQEAVSVATHFNDALNITGVILTKLDGDARGGAAISMRKVTGKPIKFITTGEKPEDLETFHPDRMASRILGMGDVVSLVEKAADFIEEDEAKKLEEKMKKNKFDLNDFLSQIGYLRKLGGFGKILDMLPGGKAMKDQVDMNPKQIDKIEAIIFSMTQKERENPEIINLSRRERIAKGSGSSVIELNQMLKRFETAKQMMGKMARQGGAGMPSLPGMPSFPGTKATKAKGLSSADKKKRRKLAQKAKRKNKKKK